MKPATACEAIAAKKRLEVRYDGFARVVEVHAVGFTKDDNGIMRVWQVRGGSDSGERTGWKLLRLEEVSSAGLIDETSEAPRSGYKKNDSAIARIVCQIE